MKRENTSLPKQLEPDIEGKSQAMPGPYRFYRDKDGCDDTWNIVAFGAERPFAVLPYWEDGDTAKSARYEATARLLAAAPQLLATMKLIDARMAEGWDCGDLELYWLVRAAVANAEEPSSQQPRVAQTRENETNFDLFALPPSVERALDEIYSYLWTENKERFVPKVREKRNIRFWWALLTLKARRDHPRGRRILSRKRP